MNSTQLVSLAFCLLVGIGAASAKAPPPAQNKKIVQACAKATSSEALMAQVFARLHGRTLSAKFCQGYTDRVLGPRPQECGTLLAHPDGRVRFDYQKPHNKTFAYDGNRALFVETDAAQVTYLDGFGASPMGQAIRVMWGQGDWQRVFAIRGAIEKGTTPQQRRIALCAREAREQIERIDVTIDVGQCDVVASEVTDKLGNTTRYTIFDKKLDVEVAKDAFEVSVPASFSTLSAPAL